MREKSVKNGAVATLHNLFGGNLENLGFIVEVQNPEFLTKVIILRGYFCFNTNIALHFMEVLRLMLQAHFSDGQLYNAEIKHSDWLRQLM